MKSTFSKILMPFLFASLFVFSACEKDEEISQPNALGVIKCTIDGVDYEFKMDQGNGLNHFDDDYYGSPNGNLIQMARYSGSDLFTIDIWKNLDQITVPTTYDNAENLADMSADPEFNVTFFQLASYTTYFNLEQEFKLKITSKTGDVLTGVFEGTLAGTSFEDIYDMEPQQKVIKITNGSFRIQLVRASVD